MVNSFIHLLVFLEVSASFLFTLSILSKNSGRFTFSICFFNFLLWQFYFISTNFFVLSSIQVLCPYTQLSRPIFFLLLQIVFWNEQSDLFGTVFFMTHLYILKSFIKEIFTIKILINNIKFVKLAIFFISWG